MIEDLKHALRIYRRTPGASLVAVAVLAVGMAFVASFVSLYVDLVLRPHPGFEESNRLVTIILTDKRNSTGLTLDGIRRISAESATLDALAGVIDGFPFSRENESGTLFGELVTQEFFSHVKPRVAQGRGFLPEDHEPDSDPVVVISHRFWQEALGGRRDVFDTTLVLTPQTFILMLSPGAEDPEPVEFRIVGIMAPEFTGTRSQPGREIAFWIPFESIAPTLVAGGDQEQPGSASAMFRSLRMQTVGKRKRAATDAAVASELNARFLADPESVVPLPGMRFDVLQGLVQNFNVRRATERQLQLFLGASVLLALVAAANVSLFLLARAPGRRRELAIRTAVGAPLRRLARQLASEATLLILTGATLGLALSLWLSAFLRGLTFFRNAQWRNVTLLDWRVLVIVGAFLGLLTLLVSLAPILGLKRLGIGASGRQVSARATVAQRVAGTAQIAIAGVLGAAAIAFAWYLGTLLLADPGYETRNIHVLRYGPNLTGPLTTEGLRLNQIRARDAIAALPGVTAVTIGGAAPGLRYGGSRTLPDPQDPGEQIRIGTVLIDEGYVELLGLRHLHGRSPEAGEYDAMLVNRSLAQRLFGRDDVVGEQVVWSGQASRGEIVGVLEDLSFEHPLATVEPTAFIMLSPSSGILFSALMLIESEQTSSALQAAVKNLADAGALEISLGSLTPLAEARKTMIAPDRARSLLTIGTAALVVLIAAFGFYGTQRYLVAAGRREYAIRASLGAGPRALGQLVLLRGLRLGLPGLVLGLPLGFIVVAWLRDDYVSRDVPPALVTLTVALGLAALLVVASIGPARHARATQPAPLLRED